MMTRGTCFYFGCWREAEPSAMSTLQGKSKRWTVGKERRARFAKYCAQGQHGRCMGIRRKNDGECACPCHTDNGS